MVPLTLTRIRLQCLVSWWCFQPNPLCQSCLSFGLCPLSFLTLHQSVVMLSFLKTSNLRLGSYLFQLSVLWKILNLSFSKCRVERFYEIMVNVFVHWHSFSPQIVDDGEFNAWKEHDFGKDLFVFQLSVFRQLPLPARHVGSDNVTSGLGTS